MRCGFAIVLFLPLPAMATTITVGPTGDVATLAEAFLLAEVGDDLLLQAGTFAGPLVIDRDLVIMGAGEGSTVIEGEAESLIDITGAHQVHLLDLTLAPSGGRAVQASDASLTLERVVISGGNHPDRGGAISQVGGTLTLEEVSLSDNRSAVGLGGHVYTRNAEVVVRGGTFETGRAERGGALFISGGSLDVSGARFEGNGVRRDEDRGVGGAIGTERATVVVHDSRFVHNSATEGQGGALSAFLGRVTITDSTFVGRPGETDVSEYFGGALAIYDAPLVLQGSTFQDLSVSHSGIEGTWGYGGAVMVFGEAGATALIQGNLFEGNAASAFGGALRLEAGPATLSGNTFRDNTADYGGALHIASSSPVSLQGDTFVGNRARFAGAIRLRPPDGAPDAELDLLHVAFQDNVAERYGGVMYAREAARVRVRESWVDKSQAELGGALMLWSVGDVEITGNRFCGNQAIGGTSPDGGAVASYLSGLGGRYVIAGNVFNENRAVGYGGAVSLWQDGPAQVANNSFLANRAASGGGLSVRGTAEVPAAVDVVNDLFAWSSGGPALFTRDVQPVTLEWGRWHENQGGDLGDGEPSLNDSHTAGEPVLQDYAPNNNCLDDRPWPALGSPLVDAGDPERLDRDGSRSDVGASGGDRSDARLWVDGDEDGWPVLWDCDDADPARSPGLDDTPYDGIDQDCTGADQRDADGDGFDGGEGGDDCDDNDASVYPSASDTPYDGLDADCAGDDDFDRDGDGWDGGPSGEDCDDGNPTVYPEAPDATGDGLDSDCDGLDGFQPGQGSPDPGGCGCQEGPVGPGLMGLALLSLGFARTRRRRTG